MARRRKCMAQRADHQATHIGRIAEAYFRLGRVDVHVDRAWVDLEKKKNGGVAVEIESIGSTRSSV